MVMNNEKRARQQTLPRHTLLAPLGKRIVAFIIDVALVLVTTIVLYLSASQFIFQSSIYSNYDKLFKEDFNSHLFYYDEESKTRKQYKEEGNYQLYLDILSYYYLNYLTGENIEVPEGSKLDVEYFKAPNYKEVVPGTETLPKDYYTVAWFNENILEIKTDEPTDATVAYFEYAKTDGVIDKTKVGVRRSEHWSTKQNAVVSVSEEETASILYEKYKSAYFSSLMNQNFYAPYYQKITFLTAISWLIPALLASIVAYIIIPLFIKNYATIGKKFQKLGLCGIDGYKMSKYQLILRAIPLLLTLVLVFLLPVPSYYICFAIGAVIFMVSVALAAASPKHASLHDYCGRTLVIDDEGSLIFNDEIDEKEFIEAEDLE